MTPVVVLFGAGIGAGIALLIGGIWSTGSRVGRMSMAKRLDPANRQAAVCAVALGVVVGLVTRWPVGAVIGAGVGWTLRSALQPTTSRRVVGRLEALATWIEALRDAVAAHRGLLAAIESTVSTAPDSGQGKRRRPGVPDRERHPARPGPVRLRPGTRRRRGRRGHRPAHPGQPFRGIGPPAPARQRRGQHPRPDRTVAAHRSRPGPTAPRHAPGDRRHIGLHRSASS